MLGTMPDFKLMYQPEIRTVSKFMQISYWGKKGKNKQKIINLVKSSLATGCKNLHVAGEINLAEKSSECFRVEVKC